MTRPVVKTNRGLVGGCEKEDYLGGKFYCFFGIPYAQPPVGDLRFRDPVPISHWEGVTDGKEEGNPCCQKDETTQNIIGSEDCLYLNVFTKQLPENENAKLKPVMVWIHGGAFRTGSNSFRDTSPEFLITEDIVLVSINYRLGLLGFLRLKDPTLNVNGNMGLKDQVEALRWVKNNIEFFNGDPNNVTIFGESAGAVAVHYHVLSPLSRNLFHKAIIQSGTALNAWGETDHDALEVAKLLEPNVKSEADALGVLQKASPEQLHEISLHIRIGPVVENPSSNAFITRRPIDIIKSGQYSRVPLIFGYTDREGLLFKALKYYSGKSFELEHIFPVKNDLEEVKRLLSEIKSLYFSSGDPDDGLIQLTTDWQFVIGILASVKNHSETSSIPIYVYKMTLDTRLNYYKHRSKIVHFRGACHADDLGYIFKNPFTPPIAELTGLEKTSIRRFVKMWTNFAKYGKPTISVEELGIDWQQVTPDQLNVLNIGPELKMEIDPEAKQLQVWKGVYRLDPRTSNYL